MYLPCVFLAVLLWTVIGEKVEVSPSNSEVKVLLGAQLSPGGPMHSAADFINPFFFIFYFLYSLFTFQMISPFLVLPHPILYN